MLKSKQLNKAWLKLSYKQQTYVPVIILERTSQFRSLIIDDLDNNFDDQEINVSLAYYAEDATLLPRSGNSYFSDLLEMNYVNLPEVKHVLKSCQYKQGHNNDHNRFTTIGSNVVLDLQKSSIYDNDNDEDLQRFYKMQLHVLLTNNNERQRSVMVLSKQQQKYHEYIFPLFNMFKLNSQFWPYKLKIDKINLLLNKLLFNVNLEIKIGFKNNAIVDAKESRKVMFIHLKPFILVRPSEGLLIPQEIISLGNNQKFSQMYKGPKPTNTQTPGYQLQNIIDAFLSLGAQVKDIHPIMKILSVILHLQRVEVEKQTDGSFDLKYTTFHIKTIDTKGDRRSSEGLKRINELLDLSPQRLQTLMIFGEFDHVVHKTFKDKQMNSKTDLLGSRQQIATYRMHVLKYILYQMFVYQVCDLINKKLCGKGVQHEKQENYKCLTLFSSGFCSREKISKMQVIQKDLVESMFWGNGRKGIEQKFGQIIKSSMIPAIIGITIIQNMTKQDKIQKLKVNPNLSLQISPRNVTPRNFMNANRFDFKNDDRLNNVLDYQEWIQNCKNNMKKNREYESKQKNELQRQLCLYKLYLQMSQYSIITQISMKLFNSVYKSQKISEIPLILDGIWENYVEIQKKKGYEFKNNTAFIANSHMILSEYRILKKVTDAVHKRKIFMESEEFGLQENGEIELGLYDFADRYLYTNHCKQKIHQKYPKPMVKMMSTSSKKDRIKNSTAYNSHESVMQSLVRKTQDYLQTQLPESFQLVIKNTFKKHPSYIRFKNNQVFWSFEEQVQNQYKAVRKIQRAYIISKHRHETKVVIFKLARQKKMYAKLSELQIRLQKMIAIRRLVDNCEQQRLYQQQKRKKIADLKKFQGKKLQKSVGYVHKGLKKRLKVQFWNAIQQRMRKLRVLQRSIGYMQKGLSGRLRMQLFVKIKQYARLKKLKIATQDIESNLKDRMKGYGFLCLKKNCLNKQDMQEEERRRKDQERQIVKDEQQKKQRIQRQIKRREQQRKRREQEQRVNREEQIRKKQGEQDRKRKQEQQRKYKIQQQIKQALDKQQKQRLKLEEQQEQEKNRKIKEEQANGLKVGQDGKEKSEEKNKEQGLKKEEDQKKEKEGEKKEQVSKGKQLAIDLPQNNAPNQPNSPVYEVNVHQIKTPVKAEYNSKQGKQVGELNHSNSYLSAKYTTKKNENQYVQKSQNLQQLTQNQLIELEDNPSASLEQWEKKSKLKFEKIQKTGKELFGKFVAITERNPVKPLQMPKPDPDIQIIQLFLHEDYISYTKDCLQCDTSEQYTSMIINQKDVILRPYFKQYPKEKYPNFYKDTFNAVLKIGKEKKSSKNLQQLLNVFVVPLIQSYYEQLRKKQKTLFQESEMIVSDYSSHHNVLKDETFFYFIKQISATEPNKFPDKNHHAYLFGLSVFTRFFSPSPNFLYPLTHYIYFLYKQGVKKGENSEYVQLLESIFENLLLFIQANQGFKRNQVQGFEVDENKQELFKNETQSAGYLHPRKSAITQFDVYRSPDSKKPCPKSLTIYLINNESFSFQIRNEIVKTIKKKALVQIGMLNREQCFSLYFFQPDYSYTIIDQKQKACHLFHLQGIYKDKGRRRPIYLKINHYFPFMLKDINSVRMVYINMISDQLTFPWIAEQYQYLVAQSMAYDDYQETRIGNYLQITNQIMVKQPNMSPIQQKYKQVAMQSTKKICEYEYLKYMKSLGLLLIRCFQRQEDPTFIVGVKPLQIVFFKNAKQISSINIKRIRNVYLKDDSKVVLELYFVGKDEQNERLRTITISNMEKPKQLFKSIWFHLENRLDV